MCGIILHAMALPLLIGKNALTLASAKKLAEAAEQFAIRSAWSVVIAVVDDGGNLLYLERMDGAPIGSVGVAHEKARTAVIFKAPTKVFEAGLSSGVTSLLKLDILPFEGGVPIIVNDSIVGAVGVSGCAASSQDGEVAEAGAQWFLGAIAGEA